MKYEDFAQEGDILLEKGFFNSVGTMAKNAGAKIGNAALSTLGSRAAEGRLKHLDLTADIMGEFQEYAAATKKPLNWVTVLTFINREWPGMLQKPAFDPIKTMFEKWKTDNGEAVRTEPTVAPAGTTPAATPTATPTTPDADKKQADKKSLMEAYRGVFLKEDASTKELSRSQLDAIFKQLAIVLIDNGMHTDVRPEDQDPSSVGASNVGGRRRNTGAHPADRFQNGNLNGASGSSAVNRDGSPAPGATSVPSLLSFPNNFIHGMAREKFDRNHINSELRSHNVSAQDSISVLRAAGRSVEEFLDALDVEPMKAAGIRAAMTGFGTPGADGNAQRLWKAPIDATKLEAWLNVINPEDLSDRNKHAIKLHADRGVSFGKMMDVFAQTPNFKMNGEIIRAMIASAKVK